MVTDMAQAAGAEQAAKKKREKKAAPEMPLEPTRRWVLAGGAVASKQGLRLLNLTTMTQFPCSATHLSHFFLCCCRSSRNEGKVVSYRFEEERGPSRPPRDGPLVKGGCWGLRMGCGCWSLGPGWRRGDAAVGLKTAAGSFQAGALLQQLHRSAPFTPWLSFPPAHLLPLVPTNLPADGECEEVYSEAHVLALGTYTKEW